MFGSPQIDAAVIAGAISLLVSCVTGGFMLRVASNRAHVDTRLAQMKGEFDQELVKLKASLDDPAAHAAERVARELLSQPAWGQRSFAAIKGKLRGFDDDRLRQILVQAGAVCFRKSDGGEYWGLLTRNEGALG